jgi:ubiquinone/menaquinone biosynthesis C-methylase UbiE
MSRSTSDRFLGKTDDYVKFRPGYPIEILDYLSKNHGFSSNAICAEVGSGTGKFSELLLQNKNKVFAVEPNGEMRGAAEKSLTAFQSFKSVSGDSVNTTLEKGSIDFIFCAQALHWFANENTAKEFKRILKPNGRVVIIWNKKAYEKSSFMKGIHKIFIEDCIDFLSVKLENIADKEILSSLFKDNYDSYSIDTKQTFNLDGLIGRMMSASYAPPEGHPKHQKFISEIKKLFQSEEKKGSVEFLYETVTYVFKF